MEIIANKACTCGGEISVTPLSIDDKEDTVILVCKECKNMQTLTDTFKEYKKENTFTRFDAETIDRYGVIGADRENYMNVNLHLDKIFVFGDNLIGKGMGGQAQIREYPNAFGVPTKRLPSMTEDSFFSDTEDEERAVKEALRKLYAMSLHGKTIVFPKDGLGTGLAEMEKRSPKLFKTMNEIIHRFWGI